MSNWLKAFRQHPESVGESLAQHWCSAMRFAIALFGSAVACTIHAFVPGLFKQTASRTITALHDQMVIHRNRSPRTDRPDR
jgi:hypothetical protein